MVENMTKNTKEKQAQRIRAVQRLRAQIPKKNNWARAYWQGVERALYNREP